MDPESSLDAVRHIGIRAGKIAAAQRIRPLRDRTVVDVKGLVVAPGFIDLHSHGQDDENYRYKARDGVTTALEMEVGVSPVAVVRPARRQIAHQFRRDCRPHPGEDGRDERHWRLPSA